MPSDEDILKNTIRVYAPMLDLAETRIPLDEGDVLLAALCAVESDYGKNNRPRIEKGYLPGGHYYKVAHVKKLYEQYGKWAAASWGPWQILFVTAWEMGFKYDPQRLALPETSIIPVVAYLNTRILCFQDVTVLDFADGYNSGSFEDSIVPTLYIKKFLEAYKGPAREWIREKMDL